MNINYVFRGFDEHSDGLKHYAEKKLLKLEKIVSSNTVIDVVFNKNNETLKETEIKVNWNGNDFIAKEAHDDFSSSIDLCVDKITKQVIKTKDKKISKRH